MTISLTLLSAGSSRGMIKRILQAEDAAAASRKNTFEKHMIKCGQRQCVHISQTGQECNEEVELDRPHAWLCWKHQVEVHGSSPREVEVIEAVKCV